MHSDFVSHFKKGKIYQRLSDKYVSPKGFLPWNTTALLLAAVGDTKLVTKMYHSVSSDAEIRPLIDCLYAVNTAAALDAPAVYIDRNLAEAILHTDVNAMERPNTVLPAFYICLPRGLLYDDDNLEICLLVVAENAAFLTCATTWSENISKERAYELWNYAKDHDQLNDLRIFAINADGAVISAPTSWDENTLVDDAYVENTNYDPIHYDKQKRQSFIQTLSKIMRLVKNVVLIYNYQKHLVQDVQVTVGKGFYKRRSNKKRTPLPTPILGRDFLVQKARAQSSNTRTTTHVRPHWRKGHWHTTLCGTGRKERRLKWFQPVYVNASLDT